MQVGGEHGLSSGCAASRRNAGRPAWHRQAAVVSDGERGILVRMQNGR
jgi:hypothetical protein